MTSRNCALLPASMIIVAISASACASAGVAARPAAFPGAPGHAAPPAPIVSGAAPRGAVSASVVQTALSLRGIRYQFGGEDPSTGLDCSGLVRYVYERHHVAVPRTVEQQFGVGAAVDLPAIESGDLIFFTTIGSGATHVGVALGPDRPGEFVHAPGTGGVVRVDRFDSSYWRSRIVGVRRVLPAD